MDPLSDYILGGKTHAKISPESLEMMGKQAANMFLEEGVALNDSIAKLAAEHADISAEQVKRIAEFANTNVYLAKHDQNKASGSEHSYPQYELADPGRIIQDLSDGARPTIVTKTDIDYSRNAKKVKTSSAKDEALFESMFKGASSEEKDYSTETIVTDVLNAKHTLVGLKDSLSSLYTQHESLFKEASADFYSSVKEHVLEGGSLADVVGALSNVSESARTHLEPVVARLLQEKVASSAYLSAQIRELSKTAHRETDHNHPIVKSYSAMVLAGTELRKQAMALSDVNENLEKIDAFIKAQFLTPKAH